MQNVETGTPIKQELPPVNIKLVFIGCLRRGLSNFVIRALRFAPWIYYFDPIVLRV
jgi:hypothetical protein